jgi:CRP-like cAMP-binding protein
MPKEDRWHLAKRRAVLVGRVARRQKTRRDILAQLSEQQGDDHARYHCIYVRHPYQPPRIAWEVLILVSVLWEMSATPYYLSFAPHSLELLNIPNWRQGAVPWIAWVLLTPSMITALDILYSFIAGWDTNDKLELHLGGIAKLYVFSFPCHFLWDVCAVVPWWLLPGASSWVHGVRMLRCVRLVRVLHHLSPDVVRRASVRFEVTRNIVTFVAITHISCCVLRSVSSVSSAEASVSEWPWLSDAALEYVDAFYTTVALFAGEPGAGSMIGIETAAAKLVATCLIILGVLINALLFGAVAVAIERSNVTKTRFREHLKIVNETLGFQKASDSQRSRVHQRYEYCWRKYREKLAMPEDDFMSRLSPAYVHDMHDGLTLEGYKLVEAFLAGGLRVSALVLAGGLHPHNPELALHQQVLALTVRLKPRFYLSGDVLFYKGSVGCEVFFLTSGCVELLDGGIRVHTIDGKHGMVGRGIFFGELAVLYGSDKLRPQMRVEQLDDSMRQNLSKLRSATARATQICDCLVLSREDLEECAEENPKLVPLIMKRLHGHPDRASEPNLLAAARSGPPAGAFDASEQEQLPDSHMAGFRAQLEQQSKDIREIKAALASMAAALPRLASQTPDSHQRHPAGMFRAAASAVKPALRTRGVTIERIHGRSTPLPANKSEAMFRL